MKRTSDVRLAVGVLATGALVALVLIGTGTSSFGGLLTVIVAVVVSGLLATGMLS